MKNDDDFIKKSTKIDITKDEKSKEKNNSPESVKTKKFPKVAKVFQKLTFYTILATVFLVPLIFSSKTFDTLELPKQMLLLILVSLSLFFWLASMIFASEFRIKKSALNVAVIILLVSSAISTMGSLSPLTSFLGFYSRGSNSLLLTTILVVFFFVCANSIQTRQQFKKLFGTFLISIGIVSLYALLQSYGVFVLPSSVTKSKIFNTVGGIENLSAILALVLLISCVIFIQKENKFKISAGILGVLSFILLVGLNVNYIWYGIIAGILGIAIISLLTRSVDYKVLSIPAFILIISIFMIFSQSFGLQLPREIQINRNTAATIVKATIKDKVLFGSGPETFVYDYSKFRPQEINKEDIWLLRFDKANNEYFQVIAEKGILGLASLAALFIILAVLSATYFIKAKDSFAKFLSLGLFGVSLFLLINNYFYYNNTAVNFIIFFLLTIAVILRGLEEEAKILSVKSLEARTFGFIIVVLALFGVISTGYFGSKIYSADIFYRKGLEKSLALETIDQAKDNFEKAVALNSYREIYQLNVARVNLILANQEGIKKEDERNVDLIREKVQAAITTGQVAINLNLKSVANWESMAVIYRNAGLYAANALPWIELCYSNAAELEPTNPYLFNGLGQVYLTSEDYDRAISMFEKAIQLKDDLADPQFNLGLVYRAKKDYSKSKKYFDKVLALQPENEDAKKQLEEIDKLEKGIAIEAEEEEFLEGRPPVEEQEIGGEKVGEE